MKVVIDGRILSSSTGRYVERLLHHLQDIDDVNRYVVLLRSQDLNRWRPRAGNFSTAVADVRPYGFSEQLGFARSLYALEADVVHFTMPQHPILYRKPHVVTVHDLTLIDFVNRYHRGVKAFYKHGVKRAIFERFMWWTARRSTAVITPTDHVRRQLVRRFGADPDKVHVTHEGADRLDVAARPTDHGQGQDYLLYVGNAFPYKNLWRLVEAFGRLGRPGLRLVLVGERDVFSRQLERRAADAGISGVIFPGFVPDEELVWLYEHARLFVFPSLSEGFGLPPLEAMRYDVPVLASHASCLPEVLGDGAHYFDPQQTADLVANIELLLDDPDRLVRLRAAGSKVVERYSWRRMAQQTLEIYERTGRRMTAASARR